MRKGRVGPLAAGALLLLITGLLAWWRYGPPSPAAADAPVESFSGARAYRVLETLVGDGIPHPLGSPQARVVRERIGAALAALDVETDVHEVWHHDGFGRVMRLENVIGKIAARPPRTIAERRLTERSMTERGDATKPLVLMAHSDSVPAGPGAGDDAAGCAVLLEIARALRAGPGLERPVWLLFTDGEEGGMQGASAFLADYANADDFHAVINVEGRGTSGPCFMFETAPQNRALIARFASAVSRPASTSLFESIYRRMPNDTDFSIFRRAGVPGYNFAYIGNVGLYHTAGDTVARVDPGSLQHHGDQALALVRALASADAPIEASGDAVFFDVLGFALVHWPASWSMWMIAAVLALLIVGAWTSGERVVDILAGVVAWVLAVTAIAVVGYGVGYLALPIRAWYAVPEWIALASLALAIAVAAAAAFVAFNVGFWALWYGGWLAATGVALTLAWLLPGAEYLFLVPAAAAVSIGFVSRALRRDDGEGSWLVVLVPAAVGAILGYPILLGMVDGFGPIVPGPAAIVVAPLIPLGVLASRRRIGGTAALSLVLAAGIAVAGALWPRDHATKPYRANLIYNQAGAQAKWWVESVVGVPSSITSALATVDVIRPRPSRGHRARRRVAPLASGPDVPTLAEPTVTLVSSRPVARGRRLRLRVASRRGARILTLALPPDFIYTSPMMRVDGERVRVALGARGEDGFAISCLTAPEEGIEIDLTVRAAEGPFRGIDLVVTDTTLGLGETRGGVVEIRDRLAVQDREGDMVVVSTKRRVE